MRYLIAINIIIFFVASISTGFWLLGKGEISAFGLNLLTNAISAILTINVIDVLMRRRDDARVLPQKAAAYEDVRLLVSRIISFWSEVYRVCVPDASPAELGELFSDRAFQYMRNLKLDTQPNVLPERTWWEWVPQTLSEHKKMADIILSRHANVLDPDVYAHVHQVATEGMDPNLIAMLRDNDVRDGFPRPPILGAYLYIPENYGQTVVELAHWCEKYFGFLSSMKMAGLRRVSEIGQWQKPESNLCRMDEVELARYAEQVAVFRARHQKSN